MSGAGSLKPALPRAHYVDESMWRLERERAFLRSWICIGRLDELGLVELAGGELTANQAVVVDLLGESIIVTTTKDGSLHAHYNVCRHRGTQLIPHDPEGTPPSRCTIQVLRCPYHAWSYHLDGRLRSAPLAGEVDPDLFSLHPVGADIWGGYLWLHATPGEAKPLRTELGEIPGRMSRYPMADLVVGYRKTYDVQANWKVIVENGNECYHCGPVHPELCKVVPAFASGGADLPWDEGIPHREGAWTFTMTGTTNREPFPDLTEAERERHKGETLLPNLMVSLAAEHVAAHVLEPLSANRTRVTFQILFAKDEVSKASFDPSDAAQLWDITNQQDWAVCELVQRGMNSRAYDQGWYAPMEEDSLDPSRWLLSRLDEHADRP